MKIICTLNLKGGCAKTTTAVSMAELLATGFKSKHGTVKHMKGITVDVGHGVKAKVSKIAKESIKVERSENKKTTYEE